MLLQVELSKVKQQKIPSGWGADSSGIVSIYLFGHLINSFLFFFNCSSEQMNVVFLAPAQQDRLE